MAHSYDDEKTACVTVDETAFAKLSTVEKLSHMLSTATYLTSTFASAVRDQSAPEHVRLRQFREIGRGMRGTVWALTGTDDTFKAANTNQEGQLYNNWKHHMRVYNAFQDVPFDLKKDIKIPDLGAWISTENTRWWDEHLHFFPTGFQPAYGFTSERIFPLTFPIREAIFDALAPKPIRKNKRIILSHPENKDCLVRLYLGRRNVQRSLFRLRNFDLMVDEMESLHLDTEHFTKIMSQALAIMHWRARIDANDVEFVLGSSPSRRFAATQAEYDKADYKTAGKFAQGLDHRRRSLGVWLLDFDQCQSFDENETGMEQLTKAFFFNDPYYPRPSAHDKRDQKLWDAFKNTYLFTSGRLTTSGMPKAFIDAVEQESAKRTSGRSMFQ